MYSILYMMYNLLYISVYTVYEQLVPYSTIFERWSTIRDPIHKTNV